MKLIIGDQEFNLKRSDVIAARTVINSFVDALRENSSFSLYLTALIMMYSKSVQMLTEMEMDYVKRVLDVIVKEEEEQKQAIEQAVTDSTKSGEEE